MYAGNISDFIKKGGCGLFSVLDESEYSAALELLGAEVKAYKKGYAVHPALTPWRCFGCVLIGCVNVCSYDIEGNRMLMATVEAGGTFGESLAFLRADNSPVYVYSTAETEILWLTVKNAFSRSDALADKLKAGFAGMLAKRTLNMNDRIQILSKHSLREKILTLLGAYLRESGTGSVEIPFNREDMAIFLGADRSALSRELAKMKAEGIIDYNKNRFTFLK